MIQLKLDKFKIISLIKIVDLVNQDLTIYKTQLKYSLKRAEVSAHLFILEELSRKLRSKFILVEHKPEHCRFMFSVNEMQAYVLILYKNNIPFIGSEFDQAVMENISAPIFKHLLN